VGVAAVKESLGPNSVPDDVSTPKATGLRREGVGLRRGCASEHTHTRHGVVCVCVREKKKKKRATTVSIRDAHHFSFLPHSVMHIFFGVWRKKEERRGCASRPQ
jgi:hypothetical protein